MTFDQLNDRWKRLVLWYHGMEKRTQLKLEALADSGFSFLVLAGVTAILLILAFKYLRFA